MQQPLADFFHDNQQEQDAREFENCVPVPGHLFYVRGFLHIGLSGGFKFE